MKAVNDAGNTALHIAASGRSDRIIQRLAERGVTPDLENGRGQTPLALATGRRTDAAAGNPTADLLRKLGAKE